MLRSRFLFLLLLLAHIGLTPAGVYTCACLVTGEPALPVQATFEHLPEQIPAGHTAVCTILAFFSLSFIVAGGLSVVTWFGFSRTYLRPFRPPS